MNRILIAVAIALAIYGVGVGVGVLLYATGNIATGATHNDCADYRHQIAEERGIPEEDVPQQAIKEATQTCLDAHTRTEDEAFRTYLIWAAWPAAICAIIFLAWPFWARILENREKAEAIQEASHLEPGT